MYQCYFTLYDKNDFARYKILLDTDLKIILYHHQNNFVEILKLMNNAAKSFDILVRAFYIIILMVQQNYFSELYPAKILDLSTKLFLVFFILSMFHSPILFLLTRLRVLREQEVSGHYDV